MLKEISTLSPNQQIPMESIFNKGNPSPSLLPMLILASCVVFALFVLQGNKGFNLGDEGYLWYGAQRVLLGEVPIRDFMAYDPGRYYWSATMMALWGNNGIMALRGAVAIFQAMGLFVGLLLIARTLKRQNYLYILLSVLVLALWMFLRHKLFDISISIFLIGILSFLIQNPTNKRYFITGICIGLVAVFGRNHGMYGVAGSFGVIAWISIKREEGPSFFKGLVLWAAGICVGFTPILVMALFVPGFAEAFWGSIRFLFELKATNLPLPVPWPWRVDFASVPKVEAIRQALIGLFFIGIVVFGVLSIAWVVWQKNHHKLVSPAFVGAAFLALPYAHFAYSRADLNHLAQGIFPAIVGLLILLAVQPVKIKWPLALMLFASSMWVMQPVHPGWQCYTSKQCVNIEISGDHLQVDPATANAIIMLRHFADKYATNGESFIAAPLWPGAYAVLERKSPMWEIFAVFPRSFAFEQAEIERIKKADPQFAFVLDIPLDSREERRFRNTHPLIYQYINETYELSPQTHELAYQVYTATKDLE